MADRETIEEQPRCEVTIYGGSKCDRPLYDDGKCICHSEDPNKDLRRFNHEIEKTLKCEDSSIIDFTNFVFPESGWEPPMMFEEKVSFANCRFNGRVDFKDREFKQEAIFSSVSFSQNASFTHAEFHGKANFENVTSSGKISFTNARFYRDADFTDAHFFKYATFWGAYFNEEAKFNKAVFHDDANFCRADFSAESLFSLTEFHQKAQFMTANFRDTVSFRSAQLGKNHTGKESEIDFSGATFHSMADFGWITDRFEHQILVAQDTGSLWGNGAVFRGNIRFENTNFLGDARFESCLFDGTTHFRNMSFKGKADFQSSKFCGKVLFGTVTFEGVSTFLAAQFFAETIFSIVYFMNETYFGGAVYHEHLHFTWARFYEKAYFSETEFRKGASFHYTEFNAPEKARFLQCDLGNVSFLHCDISKVQFKEIKWNRQRKFYQFSRNKVYDELEAGPDTYDAVAQEYRHLQLNYIQNYRYAEAGDFYIGEQEIMRKRRNWFWRVFSIHTFYLAFARYGESMIRPAFWLALLLIVSSSVFFYNGVYIESGNPVHPTSQYVDYNWSSDVKDLIFLKVDFWRVFTHNLALISFYRSGSSAPGMGSWQQLLIIAETIAAVSLITLLLLSIRRRFTRKSF